MVEVDEQCLLSAVYSLDCSHGNNKDQTGTRKQSRYEAHQLSAANGFAPRPD